MTSHISKPDFDFIIDGEFYSHGLSLQEINAAMAVKRLEPTHNTPLIRFHVFDVVQFNTPYALRYRWLFEHLICENLDNVSIVPQITCSTRQCVDVSTREFISQGYEGSMIRHLDMGYENRRTYTLLKNKPFLDGEFPVVGRKEGLGKYAGMLGALTIQVKEGVRCEVGGGFTDDQRKYYWSAPLPLYIKVKYQCVTDDGNLRHPTFICEL